MGSLGAFEDADAMRAEHEVGVSEAGRPAFTTTTTATTTLLAALAGRVLQVLFFVAAG